MTYHISTVLWLVKLLFLLGFLCFCLLPDDILNPPHHNNVWNVSSAIAYSADLFFLLITVCLSVCLSVCRGSAIAKPNPNPNPTSQMLHHLNHTQWRWFVSLFHFVFSELFCPLPTTARIYNIAIVGLSHSESSPTICLGMCLLVCVSVTLCVFVWLSVHLSHFVSVCLSACLSVHKNQVFRVSLMTPTLPRLSPHNAILIKI